MRKNSRESMITVKKEENITNVIATFTEFSDIFPDSFDTETKRTLYAEKILENGFVLTAYYKEKIVGFGAGYANDYKNKCAYASFLAVKKDIGLLSGIVLMALLRKGLEYGASKGMEVLVLEVKKDNNNAYQIYEKMGMYYGGEASEDSVYLKGSIQEALHILETIRK